MLQSKNRIDGNAARIPINKPPPIDANRPRVLTPPLVPLGTFLKVVIKIGRSLDRIPISLAQVSPLLELQYSKNTNNQNVRYIQRIISNMLD